VVLLSSCRARDSGEFPHQDQQPEPSLKLSLTAHDPDMGHGTISPVHSLSMMASQLGLQLEETACINLALYTVASFIRFTPSKGDIGEMGCPIYPYQRDLADLAGPKEVHNSRSMLHSSLHLTFTSASGRAAALLGSMPRHRNDMSTFTLPMFPLDNIVGIGNFVNMAEHGSCRYPN
jgi:hypothetical protein